MESFGVPTMTWNWVCENDYLLKSFRQRGVQPVGSIERAGRNCDRVTIQSEPQAQTILKSLLPLLPSVQTLFVFFRSIQVDVSAPCPYPSEC